MSDNLLVLTGRDMKSSMPCARPTKPIPSGTAACPTRPFSVSRTNRATGSLLCPPFWEAVNPWPYIEGI